MNEPDAIVHVIDDDESFLRAIARLLSSSGFTVRTYASARDFLRAWNPAEPGCVVSDLNMPGSDGLELQDAISQTLHPLPLVFLTGNGNISSTVRAMRTGAEDFLEKTAPMAELLAAVRRALARNARERSARARLDMLQSAFASLTPRETQVLGHVVRGRLNKQIAADLAIHERTVKLHRMALMTKLQVHSVAELTRVTQEAGLLAPLAQPAASAQASPYGA
ncbi:response regulator [Ramlibacter sp. PS3R-8]|uniref:response regulator transcription factor n=1 Tax=Ramlibacter sp. PS3R-8 TaxID=3133437 RepID=UPI0030A59756